METHFPNPKNDLQRRLHEANHETRTKDSRSPDEFAEYWLDNMPNRGKSRQEVAAALGGIAADMSALAHERYEQRVAESEHSQSVDETYDLAA